MAELLLGIDIGTYSSKGVLVQPDGKILKSKVVEHKLSFPYPGWAEQDADQVWWGDVERICHSLFDEKPFSNADVAGLAISAIGPCVLPMDNNGNPLRPGILYGIDTRATNEIKFLNNKFSKEKIYYFSGMNLSSQSAGPKIMWIKYNEPEVWKKTKYVNTASGFLVQRLTGERRIDYHTGCYFSPLMDIHKLQWSDRYAEDIIEIDKLPQLGWSNELAGYVTKSAAKQTGLKEGTPVAIGAVDALSEGISVGAINEGDLMIMYGSTTFFILTLPKLLPDPRMWSIAGAFNGQFNLAAGMATTGSLTRWFRDEFTPYLDEDKAYNILFEEVVGIPPGSGGLLVLPYFSGERTPIHDPKARGIITGLSLSHKRSHIFRAILEGVAYGIRHNIDTFKELGAEVKRIIAVGGGTQSIEWLKIVSSVSGITQIIPEVTIGASYGDAFLAGQAIGLVKTDDIHNWVVSKREIQPDSKNQLIYSNLYENYLKLYEQNKEILHDLANY